MPPEPTAASDAAAQADCSEARDLQAVARDALAEEREDAAVDRHMRASLRDVAATRRAEVVASALAEPMTNRELKNLLVATQQAAEADRSVASADRHADTDDRLASGLDRQQAAVDRRVSAADRRQASLDALTGAHSRAAGFKELGRYVDRARRAREPFTLAFIDVDGLKSINDSFGHAAGDRALVNLVQALRAQLRAHDLIVRFGGDEFLCAVASMDEAELRHRLTQVSQALGQATEHVGITVGLATLDVDETIDDLFARADAAFYSARRRR